MHTDEYEISLWREVSVCRQKVKQIQNRIGSNGGITSDSLQERGDHKALRIWQERLEQYEEQLRLMKISSGA